MKRTVLSLLAFMAMGMVANSPARAQTPTPITQPLHGYYTYGSLKEMTTEEAVNASMTATTVPMAPYTVVSSRDNNTFSGALVGRSPFYHGSRTINVPTFIVPVKIQMPDGGVFNPGVADSHCLSSKVPTTVTQKSPVFQPAPFTMNGVGVGTTQYIDAFQRAEFWQNISVTGNSYHVMLHPVTTLAEQTFNVPANEGGTFSAKGACGHLGVMNIATWDAFVQGTLIPYVAAHGGGTTAFPFFLLYNVVLADPFVPRTTDNCCILGYHQAFLAGGAIQTYGVGDFQSVALFKNIADVSAISHEVGEWMNDPIGNNPTPAYGNIGQVQGCQNNLEVGDPLSGTLFPTVALNGFNYHVQELAFFSWFYGAPSIATGSTQFSDNDSFTSPAAPCP